MARQAKPRIDVIGLGPAGPDLITAGTLKLIDEVPIRRLRTSRHPAAASVDAQSFDHYYESLDTFEQVYEAIVNDLVQLANTHRQVLYAVPGSPAVAEHTVELLLKIADVQVVVHPALSFADTTWVALGVDPIAEGVRIVDGHRFSHEAAGERGPMLVAQCHDQATLSDIKLAVEAGPDTQVTVLQRLGLDDEQIFTVAWPDLDRGVVADHLTSLWIPELPVPVGTAFSRFAVMVARLRAECPWDAEQDHATLRRYLLEECYETLEAIDHLVAAPPEADGEPMYGDLQEELGDLLYQIFFHSILAEEAGWFDVADVATAIYDKLLVRHPHVFDDVEVALEDLPAMWEAAKKSEKSRESVMDGIPAALPALVYAAKVQKKAAAIGEPAPDTRGLDAVDEADVGELLFHAVALASELGVDPESALRQHASTFADHVRMNE